MVTLCIGLKEMASLTHPIFQKYADKIGADFHVINQVKYNLGHISYESFQMREFMDYYDRFIYIDSDVLINPKSPDLFDIVSPSTIGAVYEDIGQRKKHRHQIMKDIQSRLGPVNWNGRYINNGIMVFDNIHKGLFDFDKNNIFLDKDGGYDLTMINYNIARYRYNTTPLDHRFNHMSLFSERGRNRFKSFFIHYAGRGFTREPQRVKQMEKDLSIIRMTEKCSWFLNFVRPINRLRLLSIGMLSPFVVKDE